MTGQRGRPRKAVEAKPGSLVVKLADAIHDGNGGFLSVGAVFVPADEAAGEQLKARGLAE